MDAIVLGEPLEEPEELGSLAGKDHRGDHGGNEDEERSRQGQKERGEPRAPAELLREETVEGGKEEGEEARPQNRVQKRPEDTEESEGKQAPRHHSEHARIEAPFPAFRHAGLLELDLDPLASQGELDTGLRAR
jgi:hypothetical protein